MMEIPLTDENIGFLGNLIQTIYILQKQLTKLTHSEAFAN